MGAKLELFTIIIYVAFNKVGLVTQIVFGITQMLMALILIIKTWPIKTKRTLMLRYWVIVISYFLMIVFLIPVFSNRPNFLVIVLIAVIPMLIATYFVYITYLLQKQ